MQINKSNNVGQRAARRYEGLGTFLIKLFRKHLGLVKPS